jgi:hypothetical protein
VADRFKAGRGNDLARRWCLRDLSSLTNRRGDNNRNDVRDAAQARDEERLGERDRKTKRPSSFTSGSSDFLHMTILLRVSSACHVNRTITWLSPTPGQLHKVTMSSCGTSYYLQLCLLYLSPPVVVTRDLSADDRPSFNYTALFPRARSETDKLGLAVIARDDFI